MLRIADRIKKVHKNIATDTNPLSCLCHVKQRVLTREHMQDITRMDNTRYNASLPAIYGAEWCELLFGMVDNKKVQLFYNCQEKSSSNAPTNFCLSNMLTI